MTTSTGYTNVIEHEGLLWRPKRGATSTAEEFLEARDQFICLNREAHWNPWIRDERADDLERAIHVMGEWTRAEPGHRTMTKKQLEAKMALWDREFEKRQAATKQRRDKAKARFDPERAEARLTLIERQTRLSYEQEELDRFLDGTRFPAMAANRRQEEIAKLEASIAKLIESIDGLASTVGDPEAVVDGRGWLPSDRRKRMLMYFRLDRERDVRRLREEVPDLRSQLAASTDRQERSKLRAEVDRKARELQELLDLPELNPDEMCSECPTPMANHGWVTPPFKGPCPAWPGWAARMREARAIFEQAIARNEREAEPSPVPKPQPLAVVPSGLPIAEVMARLAEIQEKFPNAEVRRGRSNRWEIWPAMEDPGTTTAGPTTRG